MSVAAGDVGMVQGAMAGVVSHTLLSRDPAYAELRVADVTVRMSEATPGGAEDHRSGSSVSAGGPGVPPILPQIQFSSGAMMGILVGGLVTIAVAVEFLRTR